MNPLADAAMMQGFVAFARIAGCFLVLPGFSAVRVPQLIRVIFVLALTASLMAYLPQQVARSSELPPAELARLLFVETIIGALLGLSARIYIAAISFAASALSSMIGYTSLVAPSALDGELEPPLATIISFAALLMIFMMDFHHDVIIAIVESYRTVPPGTPIAFNAVAEDFTRILNDSFLIVFRLATPFIAYAIMANLFVALLNRLTPALQLYFVATPAILLGGLLLAYFVLPAFLSFSGQGLQMLEPF